MHILCVREVFYAERILLRTLIIYLTLVVTMRVMGKRQLGELEVSELGARLCFCPRRRPCPSPIKTSRSPSPSCPS